MKLPLIDDQIEWLERETRDYNYAFSSLNDRNELYIRVSPYILIPDVGRSAVLELFTNVYSAKGIKENLEFLQLQLRSYI